MAHPQIERSGIVYVVQAGQFCKIGISRNLKRRLEQYRVHSSLHVTLRFAIEVPDPERLEDIIHDELKEHRHHGEWFVIGHRSAACAVSAAKARLWPPDPAEVGSRYAAAIELGKLRRYTRRPQAAQNRAQRKRP